MQTSRAAHTDPIAVVLHPKKQQAERVRTVVSEVAAERGIAEVLWFETEPDCPGTDQANEAVWRGAGTVIAAGGDGTVRATANALAGTGVALGIIPLGTGNLFARNLDLPLTGTRTMTETALSTQARPIDIGRITAWDSDSHITMADEAFCVIAGLGFDALLIESVDPVLKARFGWAAYVVSGLAHLKGARVVGHLTADGVEQQMSTRSIMVGNCGRLPGGLTLIPDADLDDGRLDIALCDTRAGLAGWVSLATRVLLHGMGFDRLPPVGPGMLLHRQATRIRFVALEPHHLQIDGEHAGSAQTIEIRIDPGSLLVRAPAPARGARDQGAAGVAREQTGMQAATASQPQKNTSEFARSSRSSQGERAAGR